MVVMTDAAPGNIVGLRRVAELVTQAILTS
jgi:hypothetical protein